MRLRLVLLPLLLVPMSGCAAAGAAFIAADTAIGVTGAAVGAAGNAAEGAVKLAIPGGGDEENDGTSQDEDGRK